MRRTFILAASAVAFGASGALAQDATPITGPAAELALSNDTLQLQYLTSGAKVGVPRSQLSAGFFLSEERDIVLSGGLLFPADIDLGRLTVLFGPRAYAALLDEENNDVMALTVGTEIHFDLDRRRGLAIVGHAFYSPDILTFGSADNLTDLSARAELRLAPQLTGFAGMRWFEFDLTDGDEQRTLQEELFAGVGWRF
ncbi:MAG: YfaZ family outer membrane protein [Steroidobacter sp.]